MRNNEAVIAIADTAQAFLRTSSVDLIKAGAPAETLFLSLAALDRYEHLPCTLEEKCQHPPKKKPANPELEQIYEHLREVVRQGMASLLEKGASSDDLSDAVFALAMLEHIKLDDKDEPPPQHRRVHTTQTVQVVPTGEVPDVVRSLLDGLFNRGGEN